MEVCLVNQSINQSIYLTIWIPAWTDSLKHSTRPKASREPGPLGRAPFFRAPGSWFISWILWEILWKIWKIHENPMENP